jgi:hypothetical protein
MIKPVFHELCSRTNLARVIDGGSQSANEAFHSLWWMMVPKHRYCSSTILRIGLGLSTIIYNNGYDSLDKLFTNVFSSMSYYSAQCFSKLAACRKSSTSKVKRRSIKRAKTITQVHQSDIGSGRILQDPIISYRANVKCYKFYERSF